MRTLKVMSLSALFLSAIMLFCSNMSLGIEGEPATRAGSPNELIDLLSKDRSQGTQKTAPSAAHQETYRAAIKAMESHMENFGNLPHDHAVHPLLQDTQHTVHAVAEASRTGNELHNAKQWQSDLTVQKIHLRDENLRHLGPAIKQRVDAHKEHLQKLAKSLGRYHAEVVRNHEQHQQH